MLDPGLPIPAHSSPERKTCELLGERVGCNKDFSSPQLADVELLLVVGLGIRPRVD